MTDEINPSELGAYTNNLPNKEGLKKLCEKVNNGGTTYTAGDNIQISDEGVISATDTKYSAGDNIAISEQNVISASVPPTLTAGNNINIDVDNKINLDGWTEVTEDKHTYFRAHFGTDKDFIVKLYNDYYIAKGDKNVITPKGYGILPCITETDSYKIDDPVSVSVLSLRSSDFLKCTLMVEKNDNGFTDGTINDVHCYDINGTTVIDSTNVDTYITNTEILKPFIAQFENSAQGFIFMPSVKSQLLFTLVTKVSQSNENINSLMAVKITNQNLISYIKNGGTLTFGGCFKFRYNSVVASTTEYTLYARDTI